MTDQAFPSLVLLRRNFPHMALPDPFGSVLEQMQQSEWASGLKPRSRVAIGVGSRGVDKIDVVVAAVVRYWIGAGHQPYLFPAMGSHGAATAEGQKEVLARYGITEATMGCPIESTLEVASLGRTPEGFEYFAGLDAWAADAVMLVNRVKWHTSFVGPIESGITKMCAIGLGKREGAKHAHRNAIRHGMERVIRSIATQITGNGKFLGGLAILEDAHHDVSHVQAIPGCELLERETELLALTKSWMARLPVKDIDVLIVDEIGKNISGTGMDAKVINRGAAVDNSPEALRIGCIYVRDLSAKTYGSAMGIGMADVMHSRIRTKMDVQAGLTNAITTGTLAQIRTPVDFPSDCECLEVAMRTAGRISLAETRVVWIRNTLELETVAVSPAITREAGKSGEMIHPSWSSQGELQSPFSERK